MQCSVSYKVSESDTGPASHQLTQPLTLHCLKCHSFLHRTRPATAHRPTHEFLAVFLSLVRDIWYLLVDTIMSVCPTVKLMMPSWILKYVDKKLLSNTNMSLNCKTKSNFPNLFCNFSFHYLMKIVIRAAPGITLVLRNLE